MIRRIRGELIAIRPESALVDVNGLVYEVFVPRPVRDRISERGIGNHVELFTYYYMQSDGNRITPYLLGFETELQRQFFERLLDVPRMGPLSALRAFILPVGRIAHAVELQDNALLEELPGVGKQTARALIAALQGKLGQFVDAAELPEVEGLVTGPCSDLEADALEVLMQLGLARNDALRRLRQVTEAHPDIDSADELVREVFRQP